jgi:nicotinamide mononucleotide (NMN) deamidase PncC
MNQLLSCRRTFIAALGIVAAMVIGLHNHADTSMAISTICSGIAGANAYAETKKSQDTEK